MTTSDNFRAIGMPIMLIATFALGALVSFRTIWGSLAAARRAGIIHVILFLAAMVAAGVSMFLYFTAAWGFGLMTTVACYLFALGVANPALLQRAGLLGLGAAVTWLAVLVGVVGNGVLDKIGKNSCNLWYGEKSKSMCKEGWLTYMQFVAMGLIAVNFMMVMLTTGSVLNPEYIEVSDTVNEGGYTAVGDAEGRKSHTM